MTGLDRRTFVIAAGAAGAALGLAKPVELVGAAQAQGAASPLNPKGLPFHKFKVGDIEVTTVFDGTVMADHNPAFVKNASIDDVKAALKAAGMPDDKRPNSYTIPIVKIGGRTVMFDSGNERGGAQGGQLEANMKAAGIDPSSLSAIVVTHFHPDHIFGLMTKENAQIYGNTEIIVSESELKYWTDPATAAALPEARRPLAQRVQATLGQWKNVRPVAAGAEVVPGIKAVATPGHTPGHTSYQMGSGTNTFMVLGDVTNIPAINLKNPGWHIMFDQDAPTAEATRRKVFDQVVADKIVCTGYHWGMPGAGTVQKDGSGYALVPVGVA
jgi:glyoxylase-like metal-dependent hydrolase (beta-lactamase superfamily II)